MRSPIKVDLVDVRARVADAIRQFENKHDGVEIRAIDILRTDTTWTKDDTPSSKVRRVDIEAVIR